MGWSGFGVAWLLAGTAGGAAEPTVTYRGTLHCGIIPGLTQYNLNELVTVEVTGHSASFDRNVRRADTTQDSGYVEHAGGQVASDGTVTLTGGATVGRRLSYTVAYTGRLPSTGGASSLVGTQIWVGQPVGRYERPCHLDLSH